VPNTRPTHRLICLTGLAGACAALSLGSCSSSGSGSSSSTVFGANVTRPPATSPAATLPDPAGLASKLAKVDGLTPVPGPNADTGPFDLNSAVRKYHSNDAEARARLTAGGLVGGYASTLQSADGSTTAGVQIYEFRDQPAANDFAEYVKEHAMQGVIDFDLTVSGVPGVTGFVQRQNSSGQSSRGTVGGALFVKGPYLVYAGATSPTGDVSATLQALTRAQFDALPVA